MYHFVGIKGSGMSALAQIMHKLGYKVEGSDIEKHFFTEEGLHELGIKVMPFNADNINKEMKIIKGAAFTDDNVEIKKALELGIPIYTYAEMVGKLTNKFKTISVCGCHGKTTVSSMLSHTLGEIVGTNYLIGDGSGDADISNEFFVLESCEYRRHFLHYNPYYTVITNIDLDHVDYFKNIDDVIDAYKEFANKTSKMVIACGDDQYTHSLDIDKPIFYYGLDDDNDIIAKNVEYKDTGVSFEVYIEDNYYGFYDLPFYGKHNLLNALAVIAICYYERIDTKEVNRVLKTFKGAKRRFQESFIGDNVVIDDYAHHPNEIKATIKAAKQKYPNKKIISIFQPHTFTRTKEFIDDYVKVLSLADEAYLLDIHPAREKQEDYPDVTSDLIIKKLENGHKLNMDDGEIFKDYKNSVLLFMSPNDISKLEEDVKKSLSN